MLVNIVYLLVSFEYTVYFIVMVYCIEFGCNSIVVVVKTFHFSVFPADAAHVAGKRKNEMFSLVQSTTIILLQPNAIQ